jgi:hypothetical protein
VPVFGQNAGLQVPVLPAVPALPLVPLLPLVPPVAIPPLPPVAPMPALPLVPPLPALPPDDVSSELSPLPASSYPNTPSSLDAHDGPREPSAMVAKQTPTKRATIDLTAGLLRSASGMWSVPSIGPLDEMKSKLMWRCLRFTQPSNFQLGCLAKVHASVRLGA